ncbi:hypothetical protein [Croceitalea rosinachiae]|uniref:MetA-pathway of phenol degradation n=1 Tax=Croceitalea rosinachiae TaxID=3075596 RepID=A0ABU3ABY2_9FLAO|nr:hypothetical protein [Croceitalea sp. F388]MDT0607067.1 hypothetical protein [Croceitalea sp. F388]
MSLTRNIIYVQNLIFLILFLTTIGVTAQIENITISKEVEIDKIYAGLLAYSNFSNKPNQNNLSSVQFGARVLLTLVPKALQVRTFGVFKSTPSIAGQFFKSYEAIFTPNNDLTIQLGVMATPTTELRPNPTTWQSQVETNSESNILGGRKGIKIKYNLSQNLNLSYGLHYHDTNPAHHVKVTYKRVIVSSYLDNGSLFFATKWKYSNGNVIATRFKNISSISSIIPISEYYKIYADIEYDDSIQDITYLELGIRRSFLENHLIKGFLSFSYNHHLKNVQGGLFIHI